MSSSQFDDEQFDIYGLGHGILDIVISVDHDELSDFGYRPGTMYPISFDVRDQLLEKLGSRDRSLVCGGSVTNTIVAASELGSRCAYTCVLGDDDFGYLSQKDLCSRHISFPHQLRRGSKTGTSIVLITPDGEKTMLTSRGAASELSPKDVQIDIARHARYLYSSAYLLAASHGNVLERLISERNSSSSKFAFSAGSPSVVEQHKAAVLDLLLSVDLLFSNCDEALALSSKSTLESAASFLSQKVSQLVITNGGSEIVLVDGGVLSKISPEKVRAPIDTTGAGDILAGGVLHGLTHDLSLSEAVKRSTALAAALISTRGARVSLPLRAIWGGN